MASDRDTLTALIEDQGYELDRGPHVEDWPEDERNLHREPGWPSFTNRAAAIQEHRREKLADAIVAAGWRPPAHTISTLDELLDLSVGTIVRSIAGTIACRFDLRRGVVFGDDRPFEWARLALPATVIPVPTEEDRDGE